MSGKGESCVVREGPDAGGVVSFVGNVRNHARGQSIEYLEYEAYPEMAEREMEKIAGEASEKWPGTRVAIAHRLVGARAGNVEPHTIFRLASYEAVTAITHGVADNLEAKRGDVPVGGFLGVGRFEMNVIE